MFVAIKYATMSKLSKLYDAIKTLREAGVSTDEIEEKISQAEEEIISNDILPIITENIAPALQEVQRELVLLVEYKPNEPISVRITRKRNITSLIHDTKTIVPTNVTIDASKQEVKRRSIQRNVGVNIASATGLRVVFPNGKVICERKAVDTLEETIRIIGVDRVAQILYTDSVLQPCKVDLLSKMRDSYYGSRQKPIGQGYLLFTCTNTDTKKRQILAISKALNLGLKVDILMP